jgi:hypothetical protein
LEGFFDVAYYSRHAGDFCVLGSILVCDVRTHIVAGLLHSIVV